LMSSVSIISEFCTSSALLSAILTLVPFLEYHLNHKIRPPIFMAFCTVIIFCKFSGITSYDRNRRVVSAFSNLNIATLAFSCNRMDSKSFLFSKAIFIHLECCSLESCKITFFDF
jgi:hypothetical protein